MNRRKEEERQRSRCPREVDVKTREGSLEAIEK